MNTPEELKAADLLPVPGAEPPVETEGTGSTKAARWRLACPVFCKRRYSLGRRWASCTGWARLLSTPPACSLQSSLLNPCPRQKSNYLWMQDRGRPTAFPISSKLDSPSRPFLRARRFSRFQPAGSFSERPSTSRARPFLFRLLRGPDISHSITGPDICRAYYTYSRVHLV